MWLSQDSTDRAAELGLTSGYLNIRVELFPRAARPLILQKWFPFTTEGGQGLDILLQNKGKTRYQAHGNSWILSLHHHSSFMLQPHGLLMIFSVDASFPTPNLLPGFVEDFATLFWLWTCPRAVPAHRVMLHTLVPWGYLPSSGPLTLTGEFRVSYLLIITKVWIVY